MIKLNSYCPFDECHQVSIKELAESLNCDYLTAQGFIKFLVSKGIASTDGTRKVEGQKGKPTNLYLIPQCIQMTFWDEKVAA